MIYCAIQSNLLFKNFLHCDILRELRVTGWCWVVFSLALSHHFQFSSEWLFNLAFLPQSVNVEQLYACHWLFTYTHRAIFQLLTLLIFHTYWCYKALCDKWVKQTLFLPSLFAPKVLVPATSLKTTEHYLGVTHKVKLSQPLWSELFISLKTCCAISVLVGCYSIRAWHTPRSPNQVLEGCSPACFGCFRATTQLIQMKTSPPAC